MPLHDCVELNAQALDKSGMRFFALSLIISVTTSTTSFKGTGDHDEWSV
jgi:hypothetical protein